VDLHPDLKLQSIYSGKSFHAEEFIREDFEVETYRERLREMVGARLNAAPEQLEEVLSLLEANLPPYNCEHVVPQSWFGKKEPMRGDLHHLFACERTCNSFRGNIPYFDFPDFEEVVRGDCGKRQESKFEPKTNKGVAARASLYFLLRYPGEIDRTAAEYEEARVKLLLAWHKRYPVTEYERHRNMAIFEKQGNRNPLVDYPELASKIDFRKGLG
jgi:endonuclease I